jgi:heme-degrading monooxygenase HmoA
VIIHVSIHTPREGKARELIESMHRFGAAGRGQPGFIEALTLRDERTGRLVGMARWEDEAAWRAGVEAMRAAVDGDPFEEWEEGDTEGFLLRPV